MAETILATFDGEVFRPKGPVDLPVNTEVRVVAVAHNAVAPEIETNGEAEEDEAKPYAMLDALADMNLDLPEDFSTKVHEYLYGKQADGPR